MSFSRRINNDKIDIRTNEKKKNILICLSKANQKEIYSSEYNLDFINDKLRKIKDFKKFQTLESFSNCLKENIDSNTLNINSPYDNKIIATIWKVFPKNNNMKQTFTLILERKMNQNLSLFFLSNYERAEKLINEIEKEEYFQSKKVKNINNFNEIIYEKGSILENIIYFKDIKKTNEPENSFINKMSEDLKLKRKDFRQVLILFYDKKDNLIETLTKIIEEKYEQHIFIIIVNETQIEKNNNEFLSSSQELELDLKYEIEQLTDIQKEYFDFNNIIILNAYEYSKIYIYLIKIYCYFNQLGDGYFKEFIENSNFSKIKEFEKEFEYLFNYHYFNIMFCGETGTGKSSAINKILGEKRAFTKSTDVSATIRENYYIHKKYPIKLIDTCGFSEGNESEDLKRNIEKIYSKEIDNILIDINNNDFSYFADKRNEIHLILYFVIRDSKTEPKNGTGLTDVLKTADDKNITIIKVINKCGEKVFFKKNERKHLIDVLNKNKDNYPFVLLDCLSNNGIDDLFKKIFDEFKKNITSELDLEKINLHLIKKEELTQIINNSLFSRKTSNKNNKIVNINNVFDLEEKLLDSALNMSAQDIKTLIIQYFGHYNDTLKFWSNFAFKIQNWRVYKWIFEDQNNYFPSLTKLVEKIYKNFEMENTGFLNQNIKDKIFQYFRIKNNNFIIEKNIIDLNITNDYNGEKKSLIDSINDNNVSINNNLQKDNSNNNFNPYINKVNEINEKYNENELLKSNKDNNKDEFTFNDFIKDFCQLGRLFWDSNFNFENEENFTDYLNYNIEEEQKINKSNELKNEIFSEEYFNKNKIKFDDIKDYVKFFFGDKNIKGPFKKEVKMVMKIFFISYISNSIIDEICGNVKKKGFRYKSICSFYFNVLLTFSRAINGFKELGEEFTKEKQRLEQYKKEKEDEENKKENGDDLLIID